MRLSAVVDHAPVAQLLPMGEEDEMKEGGTKGWERRERGRLGGYRETLPPSTTP